MADDDVTEECVVILYNVRADGATGYPVFLLHLHLLRSVDWYV